MTDTVIVGLLSLAGTLLGSVGGIMATNKLMAYRIDQLEKKVDKHNNLIARTYQLEGRVTECEHEISDLKKGA